MANIRARKTQEGVTRYQAFVRIKGYKPLMKTFDKYSKAAAWAKRIEVQMQDGTYVEQKALKKISLSEVHTEEDMMLYKRSNIETVGELLEYFKIYIAPERYTDPEKYTIMYKWWDSQIGSIKLSNLTSSMLSSCKQILATEKIKKKDKKVVRKNNTINKYLMCISAVLTYAVEDLEIIENNPMKKVKNMPKSKGRTRFLSLEEIQKLSNECKNHSPMIYLFFILLLSTGGRYSEVLHLRVEDINFESKQLFFLNTKNKEHRGVPVDDKVLNLIKDYIKENEIESGSIFKAKRNDGDYPFVRKTFMDIFKKLGIEDFHIHDIRHTTASYVAMNGGSLLDIAEILGHKSLVMARRYSHLTQKHTESLLNKVRGKILPDV
jgi:integrase